MSLRLLGQVDRVFVLCLLGVMALGLYNLSSAGRPLGEALHVSHGVHLALGLAIALAVAAIPYRHLEALAYPVFTGVVALLLATSAFGKVVNGSRRWLEIGPLNLQTSDLAKLGVILIVARTLHLVRWEGGGMTLRDLFRPMNLSRPVFLLAAILALSTLGETIRPPKLEVWSRSRYKPVLTLRSSVEGVSLGRSARSREGLRFVRLRGPGVEPVHAVLRRGSAGWDLVPRADAGITTVGGEPVTSRVVLRNGEIGRAHV